MQPIWKPELPFVSARHKTPKGKSKQQIQLIPWKMQTVRTGVQIPILKLAWAHEGIIYPLKFLGCSHRFFEMTPLRMSSWGIASEANPFLKQATSGPFFVKQHHQGTASPALFMPALPSLPCSPLYNPLPFQFKIWPNSSRWYRKVNHARNTKICTTYAYTCTFCCCCSTSSAQETGTGKE